MGDGRGGRIGAICSIGGGGGGGGGASLQFILVPPSLVDETAKLLQRAHSLVKRCVRGDGAARERRAAAKLEQLRHRLNEKRLDLQ